MVSFGRIAAVALGFALCVTSVSQPRAASWLEKNFWLSGPRYDRDVPASVTIRAFPTPSLPFPHR